MTRRTLFIALSAAVMCALAPRALAQLPPDPDYVRQEIFPSYAAFHTALTDAANLADPVARDAALDSLFATLESAGQVPYAQGNQVAFLWRGSATSAAWRGDFNGWGTSAGTRIGSSDVWMLERTFPTDARTDYKVFLNNSTWILDPDNPLQMWGGFGPNSELRMPDYQYPHETIREPGIPLGTLSSNIRTTSTSLGEDINYRVYTPAGYSSLDDLPTVYVTDGHEYSADHMGSMVAVLDNLIADGTIRPTIAVFIDPRDPDTGFNRRADHYSFNPDFAAFVADELVPLVDANYDTDATAGQRTILGTSLGGRNSAYFGVVQNDTFHNIAIQSPSSLGSVLTAYANNDLQFLNLFVSGGTFGDDNNSDALVSVLAGNGYDYEYIHVNDGHSWGAWRAQLGDMLLALVGTPLVPGDADGDGDVDLDDFDILSANMYQPVAGGPADGDFNNDGVVDFDDFVIQSLNYSPSPGETAEPASVPEPASAALLLTAILIAAGGSPRRASFRSRL